MGSRLDRPFWHKLTHPGISDAEYRQQQRRKKWRELGQAVADAAISPITPAENSRALAPMPAPRTEMTCAAPMTGASWRLWRERFVNRKGEVVATHWAVDLKNANAPVLTEIQREYRLVFPYALLPGTSTILGKQWHTYHPAGTTLEDWNTIKRQISDLIYAARSTPSLKALRERALHDPDYLLRRKDEIERRFRDVVANPVATSERRELIADFALRILHEEVEHLYPPAREDDAKLAEKKYEIRRQALLTSLRHFHEAEHTVLREVRERLFAAGEDGSFDPHAYAEHVVRELLLVEQDIDRVPELVRAALNRQTDLTAEQRGHIAALAIHVLRERVRSRR